MRIWAEVYRPDGETFELIDLQAVTVNRVLGRGGDMQLTLPGLDKRFADVQGREVRVYTNFPSKHLIMQGTIREDNYSKAAGPDAYLWKALDGLDVFKNPSTWRDLVYNDEKIGVILRDLVGRVDGWKVRLDAELENERTSARFDGIPVLDALKQLASQTGKHFQIGKNPNVVVFGALGTDSKLVIKNAARAGQGIYKNPNLLVVSKMDIIEDSYEVTNYVEPIAGGTGSAAITLKRSTRNDPYFIEEVTLNGRTAYIMRDIESITRYGQVERVWPLEEAIPVDLSLQGIVNLSNVLYDWAAAGLQRKSSPKRTYKCTVRSGSRVVLPGEMVYVSFHGDVYRNGERLSQKDVEGQFWVTRVSENYGLQGGDLTLEISNIDEPRKTAEETIADEILQQRRRQKMIKLDVASNPIPFPNVYLDYRIIEGTALTIKVPDFAFEVARCDMTLRRADFNGPDTISITVDGENRTEELGGPFLGGSGYGDSFTVDIAQWLTTNFIQGDHEITLFCAYGYGTVDITFDLGVVMGSAV